MGGNWFNKKRTQKTNKKYSHYSYLIDLLSFKTCRAKYFLFFFFYWINCILTHIYSYMINEFIHKNIQILRSGFYIKGP